MIPYRTADKSNYTFLWQNANCNRKNMTEAELVLWTQIRNRQLGVKFLRQYVIGNYIVDFFCASKQLVVEIDGKYHYVEDNPKFDQIRDQYLTQLGYKILRFTNEQVLCNIEQVLTTIQNNL